MSEFDNLWDSLLKIVPMHIELEVTTPPYKEDDAEAFFLFMGFINMVPGALKLIQDNLSALKFDASWTETLNSTAIESYLRRTGQTMEKVSSQFWGFCKPVHKKSISATVKLYMTRIGMKPSPPPAALGPPPAGGGKRKQRSRTNKRRNRTKRLYKKRRNTKRRNTKRKNTKRRNTKKRNTKRRV